MVYHLTGKQLQEADAQKDLGVWMITSLKPSLHCSKDLAIDTIQLLLQSKYDETENRLGRAQVLQLLKFCLRTYFTLHRRVETHCSEPEDKNAELQYLRRVFKANGYPRNFVNRCIRKRDERPNRTDTKVWRALPYVKNVSEAVGRLLAPFGVGVAHRPEATIRRLVMKPKDPLPRQETSGVVYRIWCSCVQSNYVGETGRQLQTRMYKTLQPCGEMALALKLRLIRRVPVTYLNLTRPKFPREPGAA
ncbi:hypothetical protein SprV_0501880700 [Sparganum proliferum]